MPMKLDEFGLRENGFCTDVYDLLFINGFPEDWLTIDGEYIVLLDPQETRYVGNHRAALKLMYPEAKEPGGNGLSGGKRRL